MSDKPALRQRKNEQKQKPSPTSANGSQPAGSTSSRRFSGAFQGLLALVLVALIYQNLGSLKRFLGSEVASTTEEREAVLGEPSGSIDFSADLPKRDAVVKAFQHAWLAYERDAMGDDEYHPISKRGSNLTDAGGIGYTVVDSIDTMQIMGLHEEYERARKWVANSMSFERDATFNTFETTIRVLGGLLAAYHLASEDPIYLERAVELADRMLPVFDTPSGLPHSMINLGRRKGVWDDNLPGIVSTAEAATLQLEFRYLSFLTDNEEYWEKAENVMKVMKNARKPFGALVPILMGAQRGQSLMSEVRLGSRGDSYYEYLLKQYLQTNRSESVYLDMYDEAMTAIHDHLLQKTMKKKLTYTVEIVPERQAAGMNWRLSLKQDHLVCFLGGSLMLGATTAGSLAHPVSIPPTAAELSKSGKRDWKTGAELVDTCMETHNTATGLAPEIVHFNHPVYGLDLAPDGDWYIKGAQPAGENPPYDARYILRPETVESLFIAFRLTGDVRYRNHGWNIFQAIEKHCRVETGGYASILNVDDVNSAKEDRMETFLMSETLKYLYLLFDDASTLPLDRYVFNTEAHPLPIFTPTMKTGFS